MTTNRESKEPSLVMRRVTKPIWTVGGVSDADGTNVDVAIDVYIAIGVLSIGVGDASHNLVVDARINRASREERPPRLAMSRTSCPHSLVSFSARQASLGRWCWSELAACCRA
jgi:hypothetical protein